jgi:uncharacterized protein
MSGELCTINSRNYDGTLRRSWHCLYRGKERSRLLFEGIFEEEVEHAELGVIRRGTISFEYYWTDRWYNIFRFHEPDGSLRNFYCNINMPPAFKGCVLDYVDLDIDIVVWPDESYVVLDEPEFEENAIRFGYTRDLRDTAAVTKNELVALVEARKFPPA